MKELLIVITENSVTEDLNKTIDSIKKQTVFANIEYKTVCNSKNSTEEIQKNEVLTSTSCKKVLFMKSGDVLENYAAEEILKYDFEVLSFDWAKALDNEGKEYIIERWKKGSVLTNDDCEILFFNPHFSIHNFVFDISFLKKHDLFFENNLSYSEFIFYTRMANKVSSLFFLRKELLIVDDLSSVPKRVVSNSSQQVDFLESSIHSIFSEFVGRKKLSAYRIHQKISKQMVDIVSSKSNNEIKKIIVSRILSALNNYDKTYIVPLKITTINFFFFRKRYIQNGDISNVLKVIEQKNKGTLESRKKRSDRFVSLVKSNKVFRPFYFMNLERKKNIQLSSYRNKPVMKNSFLLIGDSDYLFSLYSFLKENDFTVFFATNLTENIAEIDRLKNPSVEFSKQLLLSSVVISDGTKFEKQKEKPSQCYINWASENASDEDQDENSTVQTIEQKKKIAKAKKLFNKKKNAKKDERLMVFESFGGKQVSDSPRAIYEYMKEHHPEYKAVWVSDSNSSHNFSNVQYVEKYSKEWVDAITKAKFWISNARNPAWMSKPKETIYIQSWHGTPLKKLALDMDHVSMPGTNTSRYKKNFTREANRWDYLIAPNQYSKNIFKRAFGYNGMILETGYPRNDYIVKHKDDATEIIRLKKEMKIPTDKKVILYAPTWRDDEFYDVGKYKFDIKLDIKRLQKEHGDDVVLILRMHYLIADNIDLSEFGDFVIDKSKHGDIKELYLISDVMITDYSSVFFDFSLLNRPIIFFTYDLDKYEGELRGFYFNFKELSPGPICLNNDDLFIELNKALSGNWSLDPKRSEFVQQFAEWEDGTASKAIADIIVSENIETYKK